MLPQHVEETFLSSNISASACQELVTVYVSAWQCSKTSGKVNLLSRLTIKGKNIFNLWNHENRNQRIWLGSDRKIILQSKSRVTLKTFQNQKPRIYSTKKLSKLNWKWNERINNDTVPRKTHLIVDQNCPHNCIWLSNKTNPHLYY